MLNDTTTSIMTIDNCHDNSGKSPYKDWKGVLPQFQVQTTALFSYKHEHSSLSLLSSLPFTSTLLYIWCFSPNGVEKLICKLNSSFSILWPLNKACAVSVSASVSLLAVQIQVGKEPPQLRQGVLALPRTSGQVQVTNSVTRILIMMYCSIYLSPALKRMFHKEIQSGSSLYS